MVRILLEHGADSDKASGGQTPLTLAAIVDGLIWHVSHNLNSLKGYIGDSIGDYYRAC